MTARGEAAMHSFPILLIGDVERPEFEPARNPLANAARADNVARAIQRLSAGEVEPAVVVLAQSYPGEIAAADVEKLRRAAPLARIVGLLGPWCEGETRTGTPWPTVTRYYGHQAGGRLAADLKALHDGGCPTWGLSATISEDERIMATVPAGERPATTPPRGTIVIRSDGWEYVNWLFAICHAIGFQSVALEVPGTVRSVAAGIWDGRLETAEDANDIARLAASIAPAPVVALLGFPRLEQRQRAAAAGAATVLSKPCLLSELDEALPRPAGQCA